MSRLVINKNIPDNWQGEYVLKCKHCIGTNHCKYYLMYCDKLSVTLNGKVCVRVYGKRNNSDYSITNIRYVDESKLIKYSDLEMDNKL